MRHLPAETSEPRLTGDIPPLGDDTSETLRECAKLAPFLGEASEHFIANVRTRYSLLLLGEKALPVSVNEAEWGCSYVVSPFTHYITYCCAELYLLRFPPLEWIFAGMIRGLGLLLRAGDINRNVHVNNYLLSTNLYPELSGEEILAARDLLLRKFPSHALIFRSVNTYPDEGMIKRFEAAGFQRVASRRLYIQDPTSNPVKRSKGYKQDHKLFATSGYSVDGPEKITPADYPRILELYELLYIKKYSELNPRFTLDYLSWAHSTGFLRIFVLRKEGRIDGVIGYYLRGSMMTTPLFGYDTKLPAKTGLYRFLSAILLDHAREQGLILNASSGAAGFKRSRGGVGYSEFNMVYLRHLPVKRRMAWQLLTLVVNRLVLPVLVKLKL